MIRIGTCSFPLGAWVFIYCLNLGIWGVFLLSFVIERWAVYRALRKSRVLVISKYIFRQLCRMSTTIPITQRKSCPGEISPKSKAVQAWVTGITESRCTWHSGSNWASTCAVRLPPKAEPTSCLLGSCAETVDIINTVTIKFAKPMSLPGSVLKDLSVLSGKGSLPFY